VFSARRIFFAAALATMPDMRWQCRQTLEPDPQANMSQQTTHHDNEAGQADIDLDIPQGSLEAAAFAELPYTFRRDGTCTSYYNEFFG
jgi:hypothetical protein